MTRFAYDSSRLTRLERLVVCVFVRADHRRPRRSSTATMRAATNGGDEWRARAHLDVSSGAFFLVDVDCRRPRSRRALACLRQLLTD